MESCAAISGNKLNDDTGKFMSKITSLLYVPAFLSLRYLYLFYLPGSGHLFFAFAIAAIVFFVSRFSGVQLFKSVVASALVSGAITGVVFVASIMSSSEEFLNANYTVSLFLFLSAAVSAYWYSYGSDRLWPTVPVEVRSNDVKSSICIWAITLAFVLPLLLSSRDLSSLRVGGVFHDVNAVGMAYSVGLFIISFVFIVLFARVWCKWLIALIVIMAGLGYIQATGTRGTLLAILMTFGWSFCLFIFMNGILNKKVLRIIATVLIGAVSMLGFYSREIIENTAARFYRLFRADISEDLSSQDRIRIFSEYWHEIGMAWPLPIPQQPGYSHNIILELIGGYGVIGVVIFVYLLGMFFWSHRFLIRAQNAYISRYNEIRSIVFFAVTLFMFGFLQGLVSLSLPMNRGLWLGLGLMIGVWLWQKRGKPVPWQGSSRSESN